MARPKKALSSKRAASDDSDVQPTAKKAKAAPSGVQVDDEGNSYWELSSKRRLTVSKFNGKMLINIREYYEKDGKSLPGKKGIGLLIEQYAALIEAMPGIEAALEKEGEKVPRPVYDALKTKELTGEDEEDDDENEEEEEDVKPGKSKKNIEETSDEEDE